MPADAEPDVRSRGLFLDNWIAADGVRHALSTYLRDGAPGHFAATGDGWRVEKRYTLQDDTLTIAYRMTSDAEDSGAPHGHLETQINLAMPSCDGFGGRYILADGSIPGGFGQALTLTDLSQITLADSELGDGAVHLTAVPPSATTRRAHFARLPCCAMDLSDRLLIDRLVAQLLHQRQLLPASRTTPSRNPKPVSKKSCKPLASCCAGPLLATGNASPSK